MRKHPLSWHHHTRILKICTNWFNKHSCQYFRLDLIRAIFQYLTFYELDCFEETEKYVCNWIPSSNLTSLSCEITWLLMGLLPDTYNCGLRMRWECREYFPRHRRQRKPVVSDPGMHYGTCVTHVPLCMSGSLAHSDGENVPGAWATRNFTYLARGPWPGNARSQGISSHGISLLLS